MQIKWVKQEVDKSELGYYRNPSYCSIAPRTFGFLVVGEIPDGCEECDINELRQIDIYRRSARIYPFPLEEEKEAQGDFNTYEEKKETIVELAKLRDELSNILNVKQSFSR